MSLAFPFLFLIHTISVYTYDDGRGDLSQGDNPILFSQLPNDVQTDVYKILTGNANALGGSCIGIEPDYDKIELLLFESDPNTFTRIYPHNPIGIDVDAPLYILSHGYVSGLNGYKIKAFRDKYIEVYGKNILFVNWGKLAWFAYTTCVCNIPFIGAYVAQLLCNLHENYNFDLNNVHIIGHSLGGQLAGQTGKQTQKQCGRKIGRITGLDPAGPIFQIQNAGGRLYETDANFVEVVHSNSGFFGYLSKAGVVDYHLNCGTTQPGCIVVQDYSNITDVSLYLLSCAHIRAVELWPFVLETTQFKAKSCKLCSGIMPSSCIPDRQRANYISLGYTYTQPLTEDYNLVTAPYAPFAVGCSAYPSQGCV